MTDAADLLKRARETMLERSVERDTEKERAMAKTVAMFNAQFGTNMTEYQGWMFMLSLKLARAEGGSFREDDYLDAAAYTALAGECRGNTPAPVPAPVSMPFDPAASRSWEVKSQDRSV